MASRSLTCPNCQTALRPSNSLKPGTAVKCPRCQKTFRGHPERDTDPVASSCGASLFLVLGLIGGSVLVLGGVATAMVVGWLRFRSAPEAVEAEPQAALSPTPVGESAPVVQQPEPEPGPQPPRTEAPGLKGPAPSAPPKPRARPLPLPRFPDLEPRPFLVLDAAGHIDTIRKAIFTADDRHVITASYDKTVRLWDLATEQTIHTFRLPIGAGEEGLISAMALSPDGKQIAVGGLPVKAGKLGVLIYLLSLETGQIEGVLKTPHQGAITTLAYSPDGSRIASGDGSGLAIMHYLDKPGGRIYRGHRARVKDVSFSPDGMYLATASTDRTAHVVNVQTGRCQLVLRGHKQQCNCVAWSPDGKTLVTGSVDGYVRLWDVSGRKQIYRFHLREARGQLNIQIVQAAFTPDGQKVVFGGIGWKGVAGVIDLTNKKIRYFSKHSNTVMDVGVSNDGLLAVTTGGDDHETYVWKIRDSSVVHKLQGKGRSVWGVGWHADGKTIAWGNTNRGDTRKADPRLERTFDLSFLGFSDPPDDKVVRASLERDGYALEALDFFHIAIKRDGKQVAVFKPRDPRDRIYSYTLLPEGRAVMGGSFGMYLVDLRATVILRSFKGHTGLILGLATSPDGRYFLSGSGDQTLRIWDPNKQQPLLSLFVVDRDWIAWTPEGYYAASPYGERLMGWLINHNPAQLATFLPAARFHKSLYAPRLLRALLELGSVKKALVKIGREKLGLVTVAEVLPPDVAITSPDKPTGTTTEEAELEVTALARSVGKHPVTAMRLLVDGRPYRGKEGIRPFVDPREGEVSASWKVNLLPGKHSLRVLAESVVSKGISDPVEVLRQAGKEEVKPNLYVLACGISRYPEPMRLQFAASDAELISKTLSERWRGVFDKCETNVLTDARATRANILAGLAALKEKMTAADVAILFLSGHGTRDPLGQFYFVPVDVKAEDPAATCVSGLEIKRALEDIPGRVVIILDACHSGSAAGLSGDRRKLTDDLARDLVTEDYGVVVMCSSLGREFSMESPLVGAGFYTRGLTDGLSGRADFNRDQLIYIHELDFYTRQQVPKLTGGLQHPTMGMPPGIRPFPLGRAKQTTE
jgi:WD40 repeat protein